MRMATIRTTISMTTRMCLRKAQEVEGDLAEAKENSLTSSAVAFRHRVGLLPISRRQPSIFHRDSRRNYEHRGRSNDGADKFDLQHPTWLSRTAPRSNRFIPAPAAE